MRIACASSSDRHVALARYNLERRSFPDLHLIYAIPYSIPHDFLSAPWIAFVLFMHCVLQLKCLECN